MNIMSIAGTRLWSLCLALGGLIVLALALVAIFPVHATKSINTSGDDVAIRGYDVVAYFTEGRAIQGDPAFEFVWRDARWHFANADHRKRFSTEPERYAPQFGGWCAAAVANGRFYDIDPESWAIVDNKLYLNHNAEVAARWKKNLAENIDKAERVWEQQHAAR